MADEKSIDSAQERAKRDQVARLGKPIQPGDVVTLTITGVVDSVYESGGKPACTLTLHGVGGIPILVSQIEKIG